MRSSISISLSSRGKFQSPVKLQDFGTTKISEATPNQYIALILTATGHHKLGEELQNTSARKISESL
jgi:hypothetical protein